MKRCEELGDDSPILYYKPAATEPNAEDQRAKFNKSDFVLVFQVRAGIRTQAVVCCRPACL